MSRLRPQDAEARAQRALGADFSEALARGLGVISAFDEQRRALQRQELALPRDLGPHPEDGQPVLAGVGRFGPYVRHASKYKTIPTDESVLEIGMNRAVTLLAEAKATGRGRAAAKPIRIVGQHPEDEGDGQQPAPGSHCYAALPTRPSANQGSRSSERRYACAARPTSPQASSTTPR